MRADFIWVLLSRAATAFIAIVSLRIMTYFLEPVHYGIYALLTAFQGFCGLLLINPVGQHINRHTHYWWDEGTLLKRLVGYNSYILVVSSFIAVLVLLWWMQYKGTDGFITSGIVAAIAVATIVYMGTWNGTFIYILAMIGFREASVFWMMISSIVGLGFSTIFVYEYHTAASWVLGQVVGMTVGALGSGLMLRHRNGQRNVICPANKFSVLVDRQTIVSYCLPLAIATGFMWLQNSGYRFLVGGIWGVAELGVLAIGLAIASQCWAIFDSLMMQFLHPYFFRHIAEAKTDTKEVAVLSDMLNVMWPLYAAFAGFNLFLASSIVNILVDARYQGAISFVKIGIIIEFVRCTTNLWSYVSQVKRRTKQVILPYGFGVFVLWILVLIDIYYKQSIHMLTIELLISWIVTCITMIFVMQRVLPLMIDFNRWLVGIAIFSFFLIFDDIIPIKINGLNQSVTLLLLGAFLFCFVMVMMLWRNPALTRLLSVKLRNI